MWISREKGSTLMISVPSARTADLALTDSPPLDVRFTQPDFPNHPLTKRPSLFRRLLRACIRYLIAIGIGIGGTLTWQAHGDDAKQMVADWAAQRGWSLSWLLDGDGAKPSPLAGPTIAAGPGQPVVQAGTPDQTASVAVPDPVAPTTPSAPSADPQRIEAIIASLAAMREKVDQMAAAQEQMASDIAKLKAGEQEIRQRISTATPRSAAVPPSKPAPPPQPSSRPPMPLH